jgi:hypothetical protein
MYNGIKYGKTLIQGHYYETGDGKWCFSAKRDIAIQFKDKLDLETYTEACEIRAEMMNALEEIIVNDSDAMTDYFETDRIYFSKESVFYDLIINATRKKRRERCLKDIKNSKKMLAKAGSNKGFWELQIQLAEKRLATI